MRASIFTFALFFFFISTASAEIVWEKYDLNPIIEPWNIGDWAVEDINSPAVIYDPDDSLYKMWIAGHIAPGTQWMIGYGFSYDGFDWYFYSFNPVLEPGPSSWDNKDINTPNVIKIGGTYYLYYDAKSYSSSIFRIGLATSPDGINWTKSPSNPLISEGAPGSWKEFGVRGPHVIKDGALYKMWYRGIGDENDTIGYAISDDGINWYEYENNPVLPEGPSWAWDSARVTNPYVFKRGGKYIMYYTGDDESHARIGEAQSFDGITWERQTVPLIDIGESGEWDDQAVWGNEILADPANPDDYTMWYTGNDGTYLQIGIALGTWNEPQQPPWSTGSTAEASIYGDESIDNSGLVNHLAVFVLPLCMVFLFKRFQRKER